MQCSAVQCSQTVSQTFSAVSILNNVPVPFYQPSVLRSHCYVILCNITDGLWRHKCLQGKQGTLKRRHWLATESTFCIKSGFNMCGGLKVQLHSESTPLYFCAPLLVMHAEGTVISYMTVTISLRNAYTHITSSLHFTMYQQIITETFSSTFKYSRQFVICTTLAGC